MALADEVHEALATTAVSVVRDLSIGDVAHVRGAIRAMGVLRAPLSGSECVYWAVQVFEKTLLRGWQALRVIEVARDFRVVDESGVVFVMAEGATVAAAHSYISSIGRRLHVPAWLDEFTSAHDIETRVVKASGSRIVMRNKELELRETKLHDGDVVGVLGEVVACGADPEHAANGYRGVAQRLALASSADRALRVGAIEGR